MADEGQKLEAAKLSIVSPELLISKVHIHGNFYFKIPGIPGKFRGHVPF